MTNNYWLGEVRVFLSLAVGEGAYIRNHMVGFTNLGQNSTITPAVR